MTERVVEYGGKRTSVPTGMNQEDVKREMARFHPELADPKIETKTEGDTTVWVFSKKAGTKGAGGGGVRPTSAVAKVDGQDVPFELVWNKETGQCKGLLTWQGEHLSTGFMASQRGVTGAMGRLVRQASARQAVEKAERERLARWNAGLPLQMGKRADDGQG